MYKKSLLDNGTRVVTEYIPHVRSVSIGVWVSVGVRHETPANNGVSHFIEHMLFKGTKTRTAKDIAVEMDSIGGEMNAFTSKEGTTFYAKVLDEHLPIAIDLLADIMNNPVFDRREIERERRVIVEELKMVDDTPDDFVHEMYLGAVWKDNPLGMSILGTKKSLKGIGRDELIGYMRSRYTPSETVLSIAGNFKQRSLMKLLNDAFGNKKARRPAKPATRPKFTPRTVVRKRDLEQEHICFGYEGIPYTSSDRYAMYALNAIFGNSMSSRLFQEVREKRGLAYSVYSYLTQLRDTGLFTVYAAVSPSKTQQVIRVVDREIGKLRKHGVEPDELAKVKDQMKGSIVLGMENTNNRMSQLAKHEIYMGRFMTLDEVLSSIDAVTVEQINGLLDRVLDNGRRGMAALGPVDPKGIRAAAG